jgi:hypothetical protein
VGAGGVEVSGREVALDQRRRVAADPAAVDVVGGNQRPAVRMVAPLDEDPPTGSSRTTPAGSHPTPRRRSPSPSRAAPTTAAPAQAMTCAPSTVELNVGGSFVGTDGADEFHITKVNTPSTVTGAGGNDTLRTGDGPDRIDGGTGDDRIDGGFGDDVLTGGPGDTISADTAGGDCGPVYCHLGHRAASLHRQCPAATDANRCGLTGADPKRAAGSRSTASSPAIPSTPRRHHRRRSPWPSRDAVVLLR